MPAKQLYRLTDMLMENISVSKHKFEKSEASVASLCRCSCLFPSRVLWRAKVARKKWGGASQLQAISVLSQVL